MTGVNAFLFEHGSGTMWAGPPPGDFMPENNPGRLVRELIEIRPAGNEVHSYLDIVSPDAISRDHLEYILRTVPEQVPNIGLPMSFVTVPVLVRFNLVGYLLPVWYSELNRLRDAALAVFGPGLDVY
jgi:hypothetical protein